MTTTAPPSDFRLFVQKLAMQGFYALGMIEVPGAPRPEKPNFDIARAVIEDLELLKLKTEGNLGEGERLTLEKYTADLKLAFVERSGAAGGEG